MKEKKDRRKKPFGKKLLSIHNSNAWVFLLLAVSGIVLYLPALRPILLQVRVWIKDIHVYLGIISIVIIIMYLPLFAKHFSQLRKRRGPFVNLLFVFLSLAGLSITGVVLWLQRFFPSQLSSISLVFHDLLSWVLIPYTIYHSITRSKRVKKAEKEKREAAVKREPHTIDRANPVMGRKSFIRLLTGSIITISVAPFLYKWLSQTFQLNVANLPAYQKNLAENQMVPQPKPAPESLTPAGGGANGNFRPYTVTEVPVFTADNWDFRIDGLVHNKLTYNWKEFLELPRTVQVSDFHCVTGWSVLNVTWEGVLLKDFLQMAGINEKAKYVKLYSGDGVYTDSLTLSQAMMDDVIVAVLLDGQPISTEYGGPVRLVVPKMYAYKSVKWLNRIELIDKEHTGFWEERGYSKDAWVKKA